MRIILDTNILLAALIKDSLTRKIIIKSGWKFFYPYAALDEIKKYESLILEKSELTQSQYQDLLEKITSYINFVQQNALDPFIDEANSIIGNIDKNDVIFAASALAVENDGIWSDDTYFEKQSHIKVRKTVEILSLLKDI